MTRIRTLVVDDDPVAARLHASYVQELPGFELVTAVNTGEAAVNILANLRVDLLLLDIHLPGFSGIEVLHRVRDPAMPPVDVIVISSSRDRVTVRQALSAQLAGYLIKPFSRAMFTDRLMTFRDQRHAMQASNEDSFGQSDIDRFMAGAVVTSVPRATTTNEPAPDGHIALPTGLSMPTLQRVVEALRAGGSMTVRDIAEVTGIARATARRYLEYLHQNGSIDIAHRYGRPGRPELVYRIVPAVPEGW